MNKKGFTLIEIIVTIGLLALLGVGIGVSLTKVLKNQEENSYETFIEKVKSSTLLYSSNSAQIINDLEYDYGYKLVSMNDLISEGYVKGNLKNPNTNEEIKGIQTPDDPTGKEDYSKARVYYTMDKEMVIEYPFIKPNEESYLNVINYTTMYKSNEDDLCYKGINTPSLGLTIIQKDGEIRKNLTIGTDIIAYMEDGSKCTDDKLNTSTVGTYKIRYVYTIDGTNAVNNPNAKSATRTVIIKPTKPSIVEFEVSPQTNNDVYYAHYTAKIKETAFEEILYCINYYDVNVEYKESINDCKSWKKLNNKNSNNEFMLDVPNVDLKKEYPGIENKELVTFYLYTKNAFEEFDYKKMTNNNEEYRLTSTVLFNLEAGSSKVYLEDMKTEIKNPVEIKGIKNKTKFSQVMTDSNYGNNKYNRITRNGYYFDGWYTEKNGGGTKYTKSTTTEVFGVLNLYAYWKKDEEKPTCTISGSSSGLIANPKDNFGFASGVWSPNNSLTKDTTHTYTVKDWAANTGTCSTTIVDTVTKTMTGTRTVYKDVSSCTDNWENIKISSVVGNECQALGGWSCVDCWAGMGCYISKNNPTCSTVSVPVDEPYTYEIEVCPDGNYEMISGTYFCFSK